MAIVDGLTKARMLALEAANVVGGTVNGSGHLILTKHDGSTIDAGSVIGPTGPAPTITDAWPVGSIFMNTTSTNPASLLGGGTWVRFGQGRVLVSQDGSDADFDVSEETGGEKTHVLTTGEMPSHTHGAGSYTVGRRSAAGAASGVALGNATVVSDANVQGSSGNVGSDNPHNNVQPYIVVYMWKRTA